MNDYDVIVIGSGAGGLTAAVVLAQAGKKVLVCEQHYVAGGWCHSFTLEGYRFSPGVHYIGGIEPGGHMRHIYEGLGISGDIAFCEINPDGYDHIISNGERFDIPKGEENYKQRLLDRFPDEADGINGYFDAVNRIMTQVGLLVKSKTAKDAVVSAVKDPQAVAWATGTAGKLVDHFVSDPFLKAILMGQSGDHGLPPSMVSAPIHVGIMHHYYNGGYFPLGGGFAIPRALVRALKRADGELRLKTSVEKIILEDGVAVGVRIAGGEELRAEYIISNADPEITFGKLIGRDLLPKRIKRKIDRVVYSCSALSLFFATDLDLKEMGYDSGNYWYYRNHDLDEAYQKGLSDNALGDEPLEMGFITVTTLKDPSKMHSGHHTLEAFTFVGYEAFKQWEEGHASEGDIEKNPDYLALKERIIAKMIDMVEEVIPGIRDHIVFADLGTPLSNKYYVAATQGNLYGIDKRPRQIGPLSFPIRTGIKGLYMCGQSTLSHGVAGVTASGLGAARRILKCRVSDLLQQNGPPLEVYPSEDISQWPEHLQEKIAGRQSQVSAPAEDAELAEISAK